MKEVNEESKAENLNIEKMDSNKREYDNLSTLSFSSYESIDKEKLELMGQYTCDECPLIPKIISYDPNTRKIIIKCPQHGQKSLDINTYLVNSLNYNPNNWKCTDCEKIQRDEKERFKYCQCKNIYCSEHYELHKKDDEEKHKYYIDSDVFYTKCKNHESHFNEINKGFCTHCNKHYCSKCEEEHQNHSSNKIDLSDIITEKKNIEKIRESNKKYRGFISYYESLIRLNNLIIYSFDNYKNNYYNLDNINTILNKSESSVQITSTSEEIVPEEYMKKFIESFDSETNILEINNKTRKMEDYDLEILSKIQLNNLKMLVLEDNSIANIKCLQKETFQNLLILNLNSNAIEDISVLENVPFNKKLQALFLKNNNIKNISIFGKKIFDSLRELDLRFNKIVDIKVFESLDEKLENLQCLYITDNEYNKSESSEAIEKIKKLLDYEY